MKGTFWTSEVSARALSHKLGNLIYDIFVTAAPYARTHKLENLIYDFFMKEPYGGSTSKASARARKLGNLIYVFFI